MDRDETINAIRKNLKARSKTPWSVTGGKGTAWGWIEIHVAPRLRGEWDYMSDEHRAELGTLLGLDGPVHMQGHKIPSSNDYYREAIDRSAGITPSVIGSPYWD